MKNNVDKATLLRIYGLLASASAKLEQTEVAIDRLLLDLKSHREEIAVGISELTTYVDEH